MGVRVIPNLIDMVWQSGNPPKHGYYLAARRSTSIILGRPRLIVSELWFNPDANPHWWWNRGYSGDQRRSGNPMDGAVRQEILAWMPMPDPPEET